MYITTDTKSIINEAYAETVTFKNRNGTFGMI